MWSSVPKERPCNTAIHYRDYIEIIPGDDDTDDDHQYQEEDFLNEDEMEITFIGTEEPLAPASKKPKKPRTPKTPRASKATKKQAPAVKCIIPVCISSNNILLYYICILYYIQFILYTEEFSDSFPFPCRPISVATVINARMIYLKP